MSTPVQDDGRVYVVLEDYGHLGQGLLETVFVDRASVVDHIVTGQSDKPAAVFAFDPRQHDVTIGILFDVSKRAWDENIDLPQGARNLTERYDIIVPAAHDD